MGAIVPTITGHLSATDNPEPWDELIEQARADGSLVHTEREAASAARSVPLPQELDPALIAALARLGVDSLYEHQLQALEAAVDVTDDHNHRHGVRQVPVLCAADTRGAPSPPRGSGAMDLPHEGPRAGPGAVPRRDAARQSPARGGLRRRHAAGGARRRASLREPADHQPRHAARRDPPEPRRVGAALLEPVAVVVDEAHVYRGVFGSHVANVLRRCGASPPPTAASRASCSPRRRSRTRPSSPGA